MTTLTEVENKFDALIEKINAAKEEYKRVGKTLFQEYADAFFVQYPQVKAVVWNQYTPYFNDGDPCYFRIYDVCFVADEYNEDDMGSAYSYEESNIIRYSNKKDQPTDLVEACEKFEGIITGNLELMEDLFDDHVTVHLRPGKEPEVLEYDHD
jgi:hypothetical protein